VVTIVLVEPAASIFYLKLNIAGSPETPSTIYDITRCHTAEDYNCQNFHWNKQLQFPTIKIHPTVSVYAAVFSCVWSRVCSFRGRTYGYDQQVDVERFVPITHVPLYVLQPMFIAPVVIVRLYSLTSQHLKLIRSGSDKQE